MSLNDFATSMRQALVLGDSKKNYAIVSKNKGWGYCTWGDAKKCKFVQGQF